MVGKVFTIVVAVALVVGAPWVSQGVARAVTPQVAGSQQQHEEHHPPETDDQAVLVAQEQQMMRRQQGMMAEMTAMDATLNDLIAMMNAATDEAKVNAMAEVVTTLAQQRITMRSRMTEMRGQMMGHMMQHMMSAGGRASAAMCPMMQMTAGSDQGTESAEPHPN